MKKLLYEELSYKVRGACFAVYNELGFGHKENVYSQALSNELGLLFVPFEKEVFLSVRYKNDPVGNYRADFVIDNKIIIEIKAVEFMPKVYEKQLLHYLKSTSYQLGFLVNFGGPNLIIKRLLWTTDYHPRKSAMIRNNLKI